MSVLEAELSAVSVVSDTLKHGLNAITAQNAAIPNVTIQGRTLANLLGKSGNFEGPGGWNTANGTVALDATISKYGQSSGKVTPNGAGAQYGVVKDVPISETKYYLIMFEMITPATGITGRPTVYQNASFTEIKFSSFTLTPNVWRTCYVKVGPSSIAGMTGMRIAALGSDINKVALFNVDGFRFYEIDSATYDKIDVDPEYTGDRLGDKFPHVDGVKHLTNPVIAKAGKNLMPPLTEWISVHSNAQILEPYKLQLNAVAANQPSNANINVLPGKQYTLSAVQTGGADTRMGVTQLDANGLTVVPYTSLLTGEGLKTATITTAGTTTRLQIACTNNSAGTYTWEAIMLVVGDISALPLSFVGSNPDYLYVPTTLAASLDGSVSDSLVHRDGVWRKEKRFGQIDIDGAVVWGVSNNTPIGFKEYSSSAGLVVGSVANAGYLETSKLQPLTSQQNFNKVDTFYVSAVQTLYIRVAHTETGFIDATVPTSQECQAYFNGWRATSLDGNGKPTAWASSADNSLPQTNTLAYVSVNKAAGYTPYKLTYQLALTVEEIVSVEGAISLDMGMNQMELSAGVCIREKVVPKLGGGNNYIINDAGTGLESTRLSKRAVQIIGIYKNGVLDKPWIIKTDAAGYGGQRAVLTQASFDTTAEYTVTYMPLDKYGLTTNAISAALTYPGNFYMSEQQAVQRIADLETQLGTATNAIAELYKRVKGLGG